MFNDPYKTKILFDNYSLCSLYAKFDMFSDAAIKAWQINKEKIILSTSRNCEYHDVIKSSLSLRYLNLYDLCSIKHTIECFFIKKVYLIFFVFSIIRNTRSKTKMSATIESDGKHPVKRRNWSKHQQRKNVYSIVGKNVIFLQPRPRTILKK